MFANIIQNFALEPLWTPEEVQRYTQDLVVGQNDLSLKHLGIVPTPIDGLLHRVSRAYRHPSLQSELVDAAPPVQRY